jgi:hypothetical protein
MSYQSFIEPQACLIYASQWLTCHIMLGGWAFGSGDRGEAFDAEGPVFVATSSSLQWNCVEITPGVLQFIIYSFIEHSPL